jgi:hypothetical protein
METIDSIVWNMAAEIIDMYEVIMPKIADRMVSDSDWEWFADIFLIFCAARLECSWVRRG